MSLPNCSSCLVENQFSNMHLLKIELSYKICVIIIDNWTDIAELMINYEMYVQQYMLLMQCFDDRKIWKMK